jgi:hypothetical protein
MEEHPKELMVKLFEQLNATVAARAQVGGGSEGVAKAPVVDMGPVMDQKIGLATNELVERYVGLERDRVGPDVDVLVDQAFIKRWGPRILAELFSVFIQHAPGVDKLLNDEKKS